MFMGNCWPCFLMGICQVTHHFWTKRPGSQCVLEFLPKVLCGVMVRTLELSQAFHTRLSQLYLCPCIITCEVMLQQQEPIPNFSTKAWSMKLSKIGAACGEEVKRVPHIQGSISDLRSFPAYVLFSVCLFPSSIQQIIVISPTKSLKT